MLQNLMPSETRDYQIKSTKTDIKFNYKSHTPSRFQKINPILSGTHFYERYKGLNLLFYQEIMDTKDFEIFIGFIGEEIVGVKDSDFEIYYPED